MAAGPPQDTDGGFLQAHMKSSPNHPLSVHTAVGPVRGSAWDPGVPGRIAEGPVQDPWLCRECG